MSLRVSCLQFALLKKFNWKKVGLLTEAKDDLFVMVSDLILYNLYMREWCLYTYT